MNGGIGALESRGLRAPCAFRLAFGVRRVRGPGPECSLSKSRTIGDNGEMAFNAGAGEAGSAVTAEGKNWRGSNVDSFWGETSTLDGTEFEFEGEDEYLLARE